MTEAVSGKCYSPGCSGDAITRLKWRGKWVQGCNRCASRVRQGGQFEGAYVTARLRKDKLLPRVLALRRMGKTHLEIGSKLGLSGSTARKWLQGD